MYPNKGTRQYAAIAAAILASSGAAWALVLTLERALDSIHLGGVSLPELSLWEEFLPGSLRYAVIGGLIAGAWLYFRAEEEGAAAAHQCDVEAAQLEAQAAQARLQVLEAQIEPHFLFNVLATVRRLYETDTETGDRMLGNLMRYLTIALPQMRLSGSTLAREVALADAYLDLQSIRMGRRLTYGIEIPPSLRDASMPSLMLSTLVENAIKHGIAPLPAGGSIAITAREENGLLRVDVTDTGRGFVETAGGGTGLANIRARLAGQFGRDGRLMLSRVEPHGVSVSIVLPLSMATASATTT
jgi:LytS/YehU family sensor histidine kinase